MDVRSQARAEQRAVLEVIRAAFGDHGEDVAAIWDEVRGSSLERGSLVACDGPDVVGHVGLSYAWLDARRELVDVWLLSPLSVRSDRQGQGIGTALVAAAVEHARRGATPLLFLEGSPRYYGPRGFEKASDHGFAPASVRTPDAAFQVVRFSGHEAWMTGRLIYPDVWWRHDSAGLRDPDLAELEARFGRST